MDLNKVMLIGRLTKDPEMRTVASGVPVAHFAVATNRVYTDAQGAKQQTVEYHEIVMWRRLAEISAQYLRKGSKVYIEGHLQTRSWDDPNGFKRYKTEIVADNMIMLDKKEAGADESSFGGAPSRAMPYSAVPQTPVTPQQMSRPYTFTPLPEGHGRENLVTGFTEPTDQSIPPSAPSPKPMPAQEQRVEEDLPTINVNEEGEDEEVSVEDIPF